MQSMFTSFALLLATASVANGCKMAGDYYGNAVITPEGQRLVLACAEGESCPAGACTGKDISITTPPVPDGETEGCFVQVFDCGGPGDNVEFTAFGCVQTGKAGKNLLFDCPNVPTPTGEILSLTGRVNPKHAILKLINANGQPVATFTAEPL